MLHDKRCVDITSENVNMCVPWFLMACIAYEKLDNPIISDACFDELSVRMSTHWSTIQHFHKHLIIMDDPDMFKGSAVAVKWDQLPSRVWEATRHLINTQP